MFFDPLYKEQRLVPHRVPSPFLDQPPDFADVLIFAGVIQQLKDVHNNERPLYIGTSLDYRRDAGCASGGAGESLSDSSEVPAGSDKSNNLNPTTKSELKRDLNKLQDELRKIMAQFGGSTSK
ncbi:hypothetical protein DdX_17620 [Ditylenchus destructor]|uniref:Uncharacterized protein n=1 Tax=Ditylenchus destructor TaxID=166010 RepID=A0AAD4MLD5_9BILA|nr:hypothetical protein DdX_17620 [Ditylenchus destructor]